MEKENLLIKDFIQRTLEEIESSLEDKYAVEGPVNFSLEVGISKSVKGGFNIKVLDLGGKAENEAVQTVEFSIRSKEDPEFQVTQQIMGKLNTFLSQPNQKILEDLSRLPGNKANNKTIDAQSNI